MTTYFILFHKILTMRIISYAFFTDEKNLSTERIRNLSIVKSEKGEIQAYKV